MTVGVATYAFETGSCRSGNAIDCFLVARHSQPETVRDRVCAIK